MLTGFVYCLLWLSDLSSVCLSGFLNIKFSRDRQAALDDFMFVFMSKETVVKAVNVFQVEIMRLRREIFLNEFANDQIARIMCQMIRTSNSTHDKISLRNDSSQISLVSAQDSS